MKNRCIIIHTLVNCHYSHYKAYNSNSIQHTGRHKGAGQVVPKTIKVTARKPQIDKITHFHK